METLEYRNGWLTVASPSIDSFQPIARVVYYPITKGPAADFEYFLGLEVRYEGEGMYSVNKSGYYPRFRLLDGGKTLPMDSQETPIKPPRKSSKYSWIWRDGDWAKTWA